MPRPIRFDPVPPMLLGAAASLITVGGLWYAALMRGIWAAEALGPICRHGADLLILHCPACYAALAMAFAGVILAGATTAQRSLSVID